MSRTAEGLAPAVVLLSGGLDSTTVLAMAVDAGFAPHALTFDYGQRHRLELAAATAVAAQAGVVDHVELTIDLRRFGRSALTADIEVPKDRDLAATDIPITYVPARNTIFLSYALAWAEVLECSDIFLGVNAVDYSGYPDCRPEYIDAFRTMADLATRHGVEGAALAIHTPLIDLSKADIIRAGLALGVDYATTTSCYDPDDYGACGRCDACAIRLAAFEEVGVDDPIAYRPTTDRPATDQPNTNGPNTKGDGRA